MATGFSVQPFLTTNAPGTIGLDSSGYIQGMSMDSPAVRFRLNGGVLAPTETLPMVGGVAISETIPTGYIQGQSAGPKALGGYISRATSVAGAIPIQGFTVFDQAHHFISSPQSPVPSAVAGMSVHYYRLGTGARIPVACDPSLVSLQGGFPTQQVSWDFIGQRLIPYVASIAGVAITAAAYNSGTGNITFTTASGHGLSVGTDIGITGMTPAGYNGSYTTLTGTTGSTIVVAANMPYPTAASATGFGALAAGGGALPVKVIDIAANNCMTVITDPVSGLQTWNRNGACALLLI